MLTGGVVGWATYVFLGFNKRRGLQVSIVLGATGALIGGAMMPHAMMLPVAAVSGDYGAPGLLFVAAVATAVLALGNSVRDRWVA